MLFRQGRADAVPGCRDIQKTDPVTFKLEGESDWSSGEAEATQSIEFELVWWRDVQTAADAQVQPERVSE